MFLQFYTFTNFFLLLKPHMKSLLLFNSTKKSRKKKSKQTCETTKNASRFRSACVQIFLVKHVEFLPFLRFRSSKSNEPNAANSILIIHCFLNTNHPDWCEFHLKLIVILLSQHFSRSISIALIKYFYSSCITNITLFL